MLKLCCNNNGVKALNSITYSFRHPLFYSTFSSTSIKGTPSFANYLVDYLGYSKQQARSTSTKFEQLCQTTRRKHLVSSSKFIANANSVVEFLKQSGLNDSQIRIAVSSLPNVLFSKVDQTLKPRIESFLQLGFSKSDFAQVVSVNPFVLTNRTYVRAIEALKDVMGCDDDVIFIMKKSNWRATVSMGNNLVSNVALMQSYGISIKVIRERLIRAPSLFLRNTVVLKDVLIRVEEYLGIPRGSSRFVDGIHLMSSNSKKNIELKIRMFERFGWMRSDVMALIGRNPFCLALSEARIKRSLEFLMKELGYDPAYVISHSALIGYSLDKRIVPRHRVFLALKEKGLISMDYSLYSTLPLSEPRFLNKYVLPFEEVHEVYAKHTGCSPVKPLSKGSAGEEP